MTFEQIARIAHEVNRAYCQSIGDDSQVAWEYAPQWQKDSALAGVHLHIENPDAGVAASHESWMSHKISDGWVYGAVKCPELKQHPCIVPFDELPSEQKAKDFLFRGTVHALASNARPQKKPDDEEGFEMSASVSVGLVEYEYLVSRIEKLREKCIVLRRAILQTLDENAHLADGNECTLLHLKLAMLEIGAPWSGDFIQKHQKCRAAD